MHRPIWAKLIQNYEKKLNWRKKSYQIGASFKNVTLSKIKNIQVVNSDFLKNPPLN